MNADRLIRPILIVLILSWCTSSAATADDKCLACHQALGGTIPSLFRQDVHFAKNIACSGCHGGDPTNYDMEEAMDKSAGYVGVPKGDEISKMCARCHSDAGRMKSFGSSLPLEQWEALQVSVHGKLSGAGAEHAVQCVTCHNAHGIVRAKSPLSPVSSLNVVRTCSNCHASASFMRTFNPSLAVDQLDKYRTSVHGARNAKGDSKAAQCVSCHGSHSILRAAFLERSCANVSNLTHSRLLFIFINNEMELSRATFKVLLSRRLQMSAAKHPAAR